MNVIKQLCSTIMREYLREESTSTGKLGAFEWGVFLTTCLSLVVMNFTGHPNFLWLSRHFDIVPAEYWELGHLCLWVLGCFLGFVCIPVIFLFLTKQTLKDYYLGKPQGDKHWWPYVMCFLPVSGIVVWVSYWPDFQAIYPFIHISRKNLV